MRNFLRQTLTMLVGAALLGVGLAATGAFAQDAPAQPQAAAPVTVQGTLATNHYLNYQGQVFNPNGGAPLANQALNVVFRIYGDAGGGSLLWQENQVVTTNIDGLFTAELGKSNPFNLSASSTFFDGRDLFLGVAVNGEEGTPRLPIAYVPYAIFARNADSLDGLGSGDFAQVLADGIITESGGRERGDGFSSSQAADKSYLIAIDGINYSLNEYVTVVTPISQAGCPKPTAAMTNSSGGSLLVELFDTKNGERVSCKFHFIVVRP